MLFLKSVQVKSILFKLTRHIVSDIFDGKVLRLNRTLLHRYQKSSDL